MCFSSWKWKLLALKGITRFRSPTKADVTSPNIQTTTWPLSTVMEASLRVCGDGETARGEEESHKPRANMISDLQLHRSTHQNDFFDFL